MNPSKLLDWRNRTAVILASGPSLTVEQAQAVTHLPSITTNSTHELAPWADVHYACDFLWWRLNYSKVQHKSSCWTQDRMSAERYGINWVRQDAKPGLGTTNLRVNGNSGFGAINLAYLFGARRILLLGFDMREVKGRKHWHADHPAPCVQSMPFKEWLHKGALLAKELKVAGCEVVNCTPGSALTVFPLSTIEKELA